MCNRWGNIALTSRANACEHGREKVYRRYTSINVRKSELSGKRDVEGKRVIDPAEGRSEVFQRELAMLVRCALLTLFQSIAVATEARAQSAFLQTGRSGWEVSGQFAAGSSLNSESVTVGYSSKGIVDAVVSISHSSFPNPYTFYSYGANRTVAGTAFSTMFSAHIVKQDQLRYPVSICLSGGCYLGSFSAPANQYATETQVDNGYMCYGFSIYRDFSFSPTFYAQPGLQYVYSEGFGAVADRYSRPEAGRHYVRLLTAGVSFAFAISEARTIVVEPAFTSYGKKGALSISAGVVFGSCVPVRAN
jgi:hypothetical protein